ncbi:MAG: GTPase Obg [Herpetosiphonaceae bacterium]|nr:MAG: GTPase Obg [Herpetosiphonaceae bacterium]
MSDLIDQVEIYVKGGDGGDGMATFRREKYVPRGGPDGGDGGRGGHVYLQVDPSLNTLLPFRYRTRFIAGKGGNGGRARRHGANGEDLIVAVPPGTVVTTQTGDRKVSIDLVAPGQRLLAARGGKGGLGNVHFVTPANQAPKIAELGQPGEERTLRLDLKLIADVGLVGYPNAGKSTLLSAISAARPKIANYPFTTLTPNLGVVEVGDYSFVVADIPGLIEGAHMGVGLGHDFLRHIERTRLLIHVIDAAGTEGRDPLEDFHVINRELREYQPTLATQPQLVALNKMDLPPARDQLQRLRRELPVPKELIFPISAVTGEGVGPLMQRAAAMLREIPDPLRNLPRSDEVLRFPEVVTDENAFTIERVPEGFRVRGPKIERVVAMTNFAQPEAIMRLQRVLAGMGISEALEKAGIQVGDMVYIGDAELEWTEESGV